MKIKHIIIAVTILFQNNLFSNENNDFTNNCIEVYSKLDKATIEFYSIIEKSKNSKELKLAVTNYNRELMSSLNILLNDSKSKNSNIKEIATDLRNLMTDLVKMNYEYLNFITNSKYSKKELFAKGKKLLEQNSFASGFFREITLGVCSILTKDKPKNELNKQYSNLTLNQRNSLNEKMIEKFGESIKKGKDAKSKTPFEYSSRLIYEFINLEWEFEKG